MNKFNMVILILQLMIFNTATAQSPSTDMDVESQDAISNFRPSLAVVIGILGIMFSLTFLLLLYAKFCHGASPVQDAARVVDALPRSRSVLSGLDKTVIESLPFFRFSTLRGSRQGLECSVCLSKFEEVEILRLLPACKHAFHIDCIDQWLEKHTSCPLCRHTVSADDFSVFRDSSSLRYLRNESQPRADSNLELYVEREEENHHRDGSSRFSIASSFRKSDKRGKKEEELPIQNTSDSDEHNKPLHKFNHKIFVSDVVMKNRWSNVSSSDLLFLNSEMIIDISNNRFSSLESNAEQSKEATDGEIMNIREEMERKRVFEIKIKQNDSFPFPALPSAAESENCSGACSNFISPADKRSRSEITAHPRSMQFNISSSIRDSSLRGNDVREERRRRLWLPIVTRTVQWFANRERKAFTQTHNTLDSH